MAGCSGRLERPRNRAKEGTVTPQAQVIEKGGTERLYGKFLNHKSREPTPARCSAPLFPSALSSNPGRLAGFDQALPGAVKELPDGLRIEIHARLGHLGHVFRGEGMTQKNTRTA